MVDITTVKQKENNKQHYVARLMGIGFAHSISIGLQTVKEVIVALKESKEDTALIVDYMLKTFAAEDKPNLSKQFLAAYG